MQEKNLEDVANQGTGESRKEEYKELCILKGLITEDVEETNDLQLATPIASLCCQR